MGRRRRRVVIALGVLVALVGLAGFLLLREGRRREFKRECAAILERMTPASAAALYEESTPRFKQTMIVDGFLDLIERIEQTLGRFERIVAVEEVTRSSTVAGRAVRVRLELAYQRATTHGEISLLADDRGRYRLLGFSIDIPEALAARARELGARPERVRAPPEVIDAVERILDALRDGRVAEIRGAAAPAFQITVSEEALRQLTQAHAAELGAFTGLLRIVTSAHDRALDRAQVQALVQYEKQRTTATFDFQKVGGEWQLLGYKVVMPEPFVPLSGVAPDDLDEAVETAPPAAAAR